MTKSPMRVTSRKVTLRDFGIFQLKLALDGLKDVIVFQVSIAAVVLDLIAGRGERPRLFYSVVRASEAGSDSLLGQIEKLTRGGDEPRERRR